MEVPNTAVFRNSCLLLLLLVTFMAGSLAQTEQCQSILQAIDSTFQICEAFGNCTGLRCQLQQPFNGSSSFFIAHKCEDPIAVTVEVKINAGTAKVQQQYEVATGEQRRTINADFGTIFVTTSRNDTHMNFMAMMIYQGDISQRLIPEVSVPLNTTECSCESLRDLASVIQSPIERDCYNTSNCDGIRCELDVFGAVYYVEIVMLFCAKPTAIEVLVEDESFQPLSESIFNETSQQVIMVAGVNVVIDATIIHHEYSIEIESEIVIPFFGRVPLIPRHTIILDRSMCSGPVTPPPPTVSVSPPVISIPSPSSNASETCMALYGVAIGAASEPFLCGLSNDCDELNCRLDILSTHYNIDITVASCDSPPSVLIIIFDASGRLLGSASIENSVTFSVGIPEPNGTSVMAILEKKDSTVRMKVDLVVTWPQNRVDNLIPYTDIPHDCQGSLGQTEQCQSILQAIDSTLQTCEAFGNCTGLRCQLQQPFSGSSSFFVARKCEDPIAVTVEVNINAGTAKVQQQYEVATGEQRRTINADFGTVFVTTSRNDTHMNFMAMMVYQGDISQRLIPEVSVPLNTTECSCESLRDLASVIQSPIEHDCYNTSNCDGIRCELDIFGAVYYVEIVVLFCAKPTAIEVLVEDESFQPLSESIFNETSQQVIMVAGVNVVIDATIIHHEYSIEIESEIVVPIFGRVPLIPRHTIILDRSMCSGPVTPPPPTVSVSPPIISIPSPSSNASETCMALYGVAIGAASEPFLCGLNNDCDELNCRLDVLSTHYNIDITVASCDSPPSVRITIFDASRHLLGSGSVENSATFSVGIPEPNGTSVMAVFEKRDSTVRMKVDLVVTWPQNLVESLIPYTDIPYDCQEFICMNGDVRLTGGQSKNEGTVELCVNNEWAGSICDTDWDNADAAVVCRQLGFDGEGIREIPTRSAFFGEGKGLIYNSDGTAAPEQCSHRNDAGVFCQPHTADPEVVCETGAVRLMGTGSDSEGRVEVCLNNQWGTVCDDSWDDTSAAVICNQLNLPTGVTTAVPGARFGQGTGPIVLDDIKCRGDETNILSCPQLPMNVPHNCRHSEDAGVQCKGISQVSDARTSSGDESNTVAIVVPTVLVIVLIITVAVILVIIMVVRRQRSKKFFIRRASEIPIVRAESFSSRTDSEFEVAEKPETETTNSPL